MDGVKYAELASSEKEETSETVRRRVNRVREIQKERFKDDDILTNSDMGEKHIAKYCRLNADCEKALRTAYESLGLSPRARSRIIKVARTIADMSEAEEIGVGHIMEAIGYRHS